MWPKIPENISSLTADALTALADEIKACAETALASPELTAEGLAEVQTYLAHRKAFQALAESKTLAAKLAAQLADEPTPEPDPDPTPTPDPEVETDPDTDEELAAKVKTGFGQTQTAQTTETKRPTVTTMLAYDGVTGKDAGDAFADWAELAASLVERSASIRADSESSFRVARIPGKFAPDRILGENMTQNLKMFDREEMMAAYCAPATPSYELHCQNTLRRPVFNSLPGYAAPRMKVSVQSSPTLADITGGHGIWTDADDDNPASTKDSQTITCGSTTEYKMYGVWKQLTVQNLMAMSYPELVEAWLNRLGAATARMAEQQLLIAMASGATDINAPALGYGATTSILSTMLNYLALYQETQRWDITENMEAWAPRWVLYGIKMDLLRRRQTGSSVPRVATDAEVEAMFSNAGFNIHWFIDTPTWSVAIPGVGASNLNLIPQSVQILVAPPGKFALMQKGELSIGVTGNHTYRDNSSNARNRFTMFWETFEGIVNTTSCPAHILDIPVCWSGVQIDDIVINCQGGDEGGYQS